MAPLVTGDIGGRLRHAREHRGLSLRDAARQTRFSIFVLQAIERNDFDSLPGGMFRKAYVRTLAAEVGLNPDEIAADYCAQFEPPIEAVAVQDRHDVLQEKWVEQLTPSPRRSIVTLAALVVLAAAWFMLQPEPARPKAPVQTTARELVAVRMPLGVPSALTTDGRRLAASPGVLAAEAPLSIEIQATGWCWIAAAADGERVLYRLVEPGERLVIEGRRLISLRLGDAGAVTLSINEGPRRTPGRDGEVAELEVTPDNVEAVYDSAADTASPSSL